MARDKHMATRQQKVSNQFKKKVTEVFAQDLVFAFIPGSLASNRITHNSDLDMFICVRRRNKRKERIFRSWYLGLHKNTGLKADKIFYYEIMQPKTLLESLDYARSTSAQIRIQHRKSYDGIVWAGMLSGPFVGFVGDRQYYLELRTKAKKIIQKWKKAILRHIKNLPPDKFLKLYTYYG
ncbi:MAG: hypothetical protein WD989_01045 [Candidatus Paceibacterota bacterium]